MYFAFKLIQSVDSNVLLFAKIFIHSEFTNFIVFFLVCTMYNAVLCIVVNAFSWFQYLVLSRALIQYKDAILPV